jgi:hypothetical protein
MSLRPGDRNLGPRTACCLAALLALALSGGAARAEHASIDLRVARLDPETGLVKEEVSAFADTEPPQGGVKPRPLLEVKAHDRLALQFYFTNTYPHGETKGVTVAYFVVREEKARQKALPDLTKGVVTRGRFLMNFKPNCRVGARVLFTAPEPGLYLLRVQSENTQSDHEHFAAIDLSVTRGQ